MAKLMWVNRLRINAILLVPQIAANYDNSQTSWRWPTYWFSVYRLRMLLGGWSPTEGTMK
jgi:hypothetical protein